MLSEITVYTVEQVIQLRKNRMLTVNPEYQRGPVWKEAQKKRLIDSLLRGYPLPLFYFHHIETTVAGMRREDLEIIDGQQRIDALFEFHEGAWKLFDPAREDKEARFPQFIKERPCPWAGKSFEALPPELQTQFLHTPLSVAKIGTDEINESRDLFIRLQAGLPLNAQEKRDAWPGGFTEFVLKIGGKPEIARYPGHDFFRRLSAIHMVRGRGKHRQLCAQMAMLLMHHQAGTWTDIGTRAIDDFYYRHLDFAAGSAVAKRFEVTLDLLVRWLGDGKRRRLKGHEAIHLLLLIDSLLDDYVNTWEQRLAPAFDEFMAAVARDKKTRRQPQPGEFWTRYDALTRTASDRADTIQLRHQFFAQKMHGLMAPLQLKDSTRGYGPVERDIVYLRDRKMCAVCGQQIPWSDLEIHHVDEHHKGGETTVENAVAVHTRCHPKGAAAAAFREQYRQRTKAPKAAPAGSETAPTTDEDSETQRVYRGLTSGKSVMWFQDWTFMVNDVPGYRYTDEQLLEMWRKEFPNARGAVFDGDLERRLNILRVIRGHYNIGRAGHGHRDATGNIVGGAQSLSLPYRDDGERYVYSDRWLKGILSRRPELDRPPR